MVRFISIVLVIGWTLPLFAQMPAARSAHNAAQNAAAAKKTVDVHHPPVETAIFQNVSPGKTTAEELTQLWKEPIRETSIEDQTTVRLYSIEFLNHIEITIKEGIVRSIVIQLDTPFPEGEVRASLESELLKSKPVLIPDETGEIIGEVFPEKGVVFLFAPQNEQGQLLVRQIGIEPVSADPFILRAEAVLFDQPTEAKRDLEDAIRLKTEDGKAYWLLAQIELMSGHIEAAVINCEKAIQRSEDKPQYHLTFVQAMIQMNRVEEAKQYLRESLDIFDRYPHEKAKALTILGELYRSSRQPDNELAYECHAEAIKIASALINHSNPTIRLTAKDVLFEAHLATAKAIAWGKWDKKNEAIVKWIDRAKALARDNELAAAKRYSKEYQFKIAAYALSTLVGAPENVNIDLYIEDVMEAGNALVQSAKDPILVSKYNWETSISLYDAVQIFQLRKQFSSALKYGELAAHYMELGIKGRDSDTDLFLLARLYFRLGAIHSLGSENHRAAIEWFEIAKPIYEKLLPKMDTPALGQAGETLVSMGISYWHTAQREEAIRLTERGLRQIERAVRANAVDAASLAIPYTNLAKMFNDLGDTEQAAKYSRLAATIEKKIR